MMMSAAPEDDCKPACDVTSCEPEKSHEGQAPVSLPSGVSSENKNPVLIEFLIEVNTSCLFVERHVSIQTSLEGLEMLVDLNGGNETLFNWWNIENECKLLELYLPYWPCPFTAGRKSCPLCPEEKFKACYSHKLRRHLQNLHWKVYVEFEGKWMCIEAALWRRSV